MKNLQTQIGKKFNFNVMQREDGYWYVCAPFGDSKLWATQNGLAVTEEYYGAKPYISKEHAAKQAASLNKAEEGRAVK